MSSTREPSLKPLADFPKEKRVLKSNDFKRIMDHGAKVVCSELVIFASPNEAGSRLGLVVSRKVGNAVVRNRVKRRLREVYRLMFASFKEPFDLVIVARFRAKEVSYVQLDRALQRCLSRLFQSRPAVPASAPLGVAP